MPYEHVLTVYDGSTHSEEVLDMVCRIVRPHHARLTILIVKIVPLTEELPTYKLGADPEIDELVKRAETRAGSLRVNAAISVRYARALGPTVVSEARLHGVDLVALSVPDLELLPESAYYVKIGGRCNHYGPRDDNAHQGCRTPDNNHWGALLTLQAIDSIAAEYHRIFPDNLLLAINDISLPMGGRFDINGLWVGNRKHQYHRFGRDVDVRSGTIPVGDDFEDANANGQYDAGEPLTSDANRNGRFDSNRREFVEICLEEGALEVLLESDPEHFHVYFWRHP